MPLKDDVFTGLFYRAHNPIYAGDPLSGAGAALYGGRFNAMRVEALYTSLNPVTALAEAYQAGRPQPTTVVTYAAENLGPIFDTRDTAALALYGMTPALLADDDWRTKMNNGPPVPTQDFARDLIGAGYVGMLVRSFALRAPEDGLNMVLWKWGEPTVTYIDDEDRLGRVYSTGSTGG